ncbi:MAG: DUF4166 domain-containing protein [Burkholderiales bacterium]|nr:DUF4166 domain-containing protein [Burkholderiales bacterium]
MSTDSLYARVLGKHFAQLPTVLRIFHGVPGLHWQGRATVVGSTNLLLRAMAGLAGLPKPGVCVAVSVHVARTVRGESWLRDFAGRPMMSTQHPFGAAIMETIGLLRVHLSSRVANGVLYQHALVGRLIGIPLPRWLGFSVYAREWAEGERLHFSVACFLFGRPLLRYTGNLACLIPFANDV